MVCSMSACLTRTSAGLFTAALFGIGACYSTGHNEGPDSPSDRARSQPDAAIRKAPRAETKKKKPPQTERQAWRLICHAERLSGADREADRGKRGDIVASWLAGQLKNKTVIYWYLAFGKMKKPEQPAIFRAEARKTGFGDCPLERLLFQTPSPTPDAGAGADH